jgi:hypothetical protein
MADKIVISGVHPWDGEYEFDIGGHPLTTKEWGWIKRLAGYLPDTVDEGLTDPETITAFAAIALRRAGRIDDREVAETFDHLADQPFGQGKIVLKLDREARKAEEEEDADPPEPSSSSNDDTTGLESKPSSEISLVHPKPSGISDSASSESGQARSAS